MERLERDAVDQYIEMLAVPGDTRAARHVIFLLIQLPFMNDVDYVSLTTNVG